MSTIDQQIDALEFERDGYATFGRDDRVKDVDEQLAHWNALREKHGGNADAADPAAKKSKSVGGEIITEAEAAREDPAKDGEKRANALAAKHAGEKLDVAGVPVVTEAEVAEHDSPEKVEERSNALADQQASEPTPATADPHVVTEAEVAQTVDSGEVKRPARNASSEEWRAFAKSLPAPLDVADNAGRDEIVAAYIDTFAPGANASKETWVKYATDHDIDPADLSRDGLRKAAVDAGWANADEPPVAATPASKHTTQDKTPRTKR